MRAIGFSRLGIPEKAVNNVDNSFPVFLVKVRKSAEQGSIFFILDSEEKGDRFIFQGG
jgi:hypothetical protein